MRAQFAELNRLEADLATRLGPRHPDTSSIRAQVQRMRGQINDELERIARAARSDYERARANEEALSARLAGLKQQALGVSQSLVRLRELEREAQASRSIYEAFLGRTREVSEQQRLDTGNARVISPALPPERPNGPSAPVILLLGAALGATMGALFAFLSDKLRGRVQSARQLTALTSLPLIGELPRPRKLRVPHNREKRAAMPLARLLDGPTFQIAGYVHDALSRNRSGAKRIVTVTAADDARTKTAVALAIAVDGASRGFKTLLIDADSGSRGLTRALGRGAKGLDDVLAGHASLAEVGTVDPHTGVTTLLGRARRPWPTKGPASGAIRAFIDREAADFDLIVVDADLSGHAGRVRGFAEAATDIVLLARAGVTRLSAIEEACLSLGPNAAKLVGIVLTLPAGARARSLQRVQAPWFQTELA
jgi:Mrp family chromosome partitioning ATPase